MNGNGRKARTSSRARKLFVTLIAASSLALASCTLDSLSETAPDDGGKVASKSDSQFDSGKEHLGNGRYGLALESFKAALAEQPDSVRTLNALGVTYDKLGRGDIAEVYYKRALVIDPESVQTINNLGYSLLLRGRAKDAAILLAQAAKAGDKDGQSIVAARNYQMALKAAGNLDTAKIENASLTGSSAEPSATPVCTVSPVWLERSGERVYTLITEPSAAAAAAMHQLSMASDRRDAAGQGTTKDCATAVRAAFGVVPRLNAGNVPENAVERSPLKALPAPDTVVAADRKGQPGPEKRQAASEKPSAKPADSNHQLTVDVSNGAGRDNLAARIRQYYETKGLRVDRITNAANFNHTATVIFYRKGYEKKAQQYANVLPTAPKIEMAEPMSTDLRVLLGHDILNFDSASLLNSNKKLSFLTESGS